MQGVGLRADQLQAPGHPGNRACRHRRSECTGDLGERQALGEQPAQGDLVDYRLLFGGGHQIWLAMSRTND